MKALLSKTALVVACSLLIISGSALIALGYSWNPGISGRVIDSRADGALDDVRDIEEVLYGEASLIKLSWEELKGGNKKDPMELEASDMDLVNMSAVVTGDGVYLGHERVRVMEMDIWEDMTRSGIAPGRAGKGPVEIWNRVLNSTVEARWVAEEEINGRKARIYMLEIEDAPISIDSMTDLAPDLSSMPASMDIEVFYTDRSRIALDMETSVPLDMSLDIGVDMLFPDAYLLPVFDHSVNFVEQTVRSISQDDPSTVETHSYHVARHVEGRIDPADPDVALIREWKVTYDAGTKERISEGDEESYAVDIIDHTYRTGYMGTKREGLHQFLTGRPEAKDQSMWDVTASRLNTAKYISGPTDGSETPMVFRMEAKDIPVDPEDYLISRVGVGGFFMDTVQTWKVSSRTGTLLDYSIEGTVKIRSSGPLGIVERWLADYNVTFSDNTTDELKKVERLYHAFLLPLSGRRSEVFSLRASFTDEFGIAMKGISEEVGLYLRILRIFIPSLLFASGTVLIGIPALVALIWVGRAHLSGRGGGSSLESSLNSSPRFSPKDGP